MNQRWSRWGRALGLAAMLLPATGLAQNPPAAPDEEKLPSPPEIPSVTLGPTLPTVPVRRGPLGPNWVLVDSKKLVKDPDAIWILDFAFRPVRIEQVDIPGKGRRPVHYMYYRVINHTGKPRMFVPQFTLVTDTGKRYEDTVLPQAVQKIQAREDVTVPVRGAVNIVGMLPPSGEKEGVEDAVFGVAVWEGVDPHADAFTVYVRGLSNGYQEIEVPGQTEERQVRYKTLKIDFTRPGDERQIHEREIRLKDPAYEWVYW